MGGAESHDKEWRVGQERAGGDKIWFAEERITEQDLRNLPDRQIDIIVSHAAPREFGVWGGGHEPEFESLEEAQELMSLLMRHWNGIVGELEEHGVYEMLLDEPDERGVPGRRWARGFMQGVHLRRQGWRELLTDENEGQLLAIALVAGEVDSGFPREVLSPEKADELVVLMGAGVGRANRHFKAQRRVPATAGRRRAEPVRRATTKVGRNDPCPCGSGRKYKQCCGASGRGLH